MNAEQVARNDAIFREANERIEQAAKRAEAAPLAAELDPRSD